MPAAFEEAASPEAVDVPVPPPHAVKIKSDEASKIMFFFINVFPFVGLPLFKVLNVIRVTH